MEQPQEDQIESLEKENKVLREKLEAIKGRRKFWTSIQLKGVNFMSSILLGGQLKDSIAQLFDEISNKEVKRQTLSAVTSHVLWRFTRIGILGILLALLPSIFLIIQTILLKQQNRKIDLQSERMVQQTYLQEAERRSSLIFLFSDVMSAMDGELKSGTRQLSNELVGRIIALSHAFKPYTYLDGDSLIEIPTSPERGQLLLALIESRLDSLSYVEIFKRGNFSYAELAGMDLSGVNLSWIDLSHANLAGVNLSGSMMQHVRLNDASLVDATMRGVDLSYSYLAKADFSDAFLAESIMKGCIAWEASFVRAKIWRSDIRYSSFAKANLQEANLLETIAYNPFDYTYVCSDSRRQWHQMLNVPEEANDHFFSPKYGNRSFYDLEYDNKFPVSFEGANLQGANLVNSILNNANFEYADLRDATICSFYFHGVKLNGAKLKGTTFNSTYLQMGHFLYGIQNEADFVGVYMNSGGKKFADFPVHRMETKERVDSLTALKYLQKNTIDISDQYCGLFRDPVFLLGRSPRCNYPKRKNSNPNFVGSASIAPGPFNDKLDSLFQIQQDCGSVDSMVFQNQSKDGRDLSPYMIDLFNRYCYLKVVNPASNPLIHIVDPNVGIQCSPGFTLFHYDFGYKGQYYFIDDLSFLE